MPKSISTRFAKENSEPPGPRFVYNGIGPAGAPGMGRDGVHAVSAATLAASTLRHNPSLGFETPGLPGIFFLGARRPALVDGTRLIR